MDIEKELCRVFRYVGVEFSQNNELKSENLFGTAIGLRARDMLVVFFLVEKIFNIEIEEDVIVNGEFNSYNKILEVIKNNK